MKMNNTLAAIKLQKLEGQRTESLSTSELLCWALGVLTAAIYAKSLHIGSYERLLLSIHSLDVFALFAIGVCFWRLRQYSGRSARRKEFWLCVAMILSMIPLSLIRSTIGLGLGFALLAILCRVFDRNDNLFAASVLLAAMATHFTFAPVLYRLFLSPILAVDVHLVGNVLSALRPDLHWNETTFEGFDGARKFGITLVGACSSFNNISGAVLVHMTWAMALRTHLTKLDGVALAATILLATALNVIRIVLSAWSRESYNFWHGTSPDLPVGALLFLISQTLLVIATGYLTAVYASDKRRI
jgi:hypothetical protein